MKTYGTIDRKQGKWILEPEPHVELLLKRNFPKIGRKQHGRLLLTDTPEICRDLRWFVRRYPMVIKSAFLANYMKEQGAKHRQDEVLIDKLLSGQQKASDYELAVPPREYQRVAADMCLTKRGLLDCDELGLGKSAIGICILSRAIARPALVVTMTHLTRQWASEIRKFAPQLKTHIIKKGTPYDFVKRESRNGQRILAPENPDVLIMNYHKLAGWGATLGRLIKGKAVVFDEAAELRHTDTARYSAAKHIADSAGLRLLLTATPVYNYGDEIWNLINISMPGALGSKTEFLEMWCERMNSRGQASLSDPKAFGSYARAAGLMLRRTRKDVGRELPDLTHSVQMVDSDSEELDKIVSPAADLARRILSQSPSIKGEQFRASGQLDMLVRQATGIAKAPYVAKFVRMLVESEEPVVLYGWHRAVYDIWMEQLKDLNPVLFTGSESPNQKEASKQKFLDGESRLLIMSLRAGAGLDGLQTVCRTVAYGELDWSPAVHEQGTGRVHRDQQKDPVVAYYLISAEGSDPIISDVLGLKKAQSDGLKNPTGETEILQDTGGQHVRKLAEHYLKLSQRRDAAQ